MQCCTRLLELISLPLHRSSALPCSWGLLAGRSSSVGWKVGCLSRWMWGWSIVGVHPIVMLRTASGNLQMRRSTHVNQISFAIENEGSKVPLRELSAPLLWNSLVERLDLSLLRSSSSLTGM
jgi:hypothetical protein